MSTDDDTESTGDEAREEREREFSRRAMLRAGAVLPIGLAFGGLAAACGGSDHADATKSSTTSSSSSTSSTTSTSTPGGGTTAHSDHNDSTSNRRHSDHADAPHVDTPHADTEHADITPEPRTIHDDAGVSPHNDVTSRGIITTNPPHNDLAAFTDHGDSGFHADESVTVPGDHTDTPHVDTVHGDTAHADHN